MEYKTIVSDQQTGATGASSPTGEEAMNESKYTGHVSDGGLQGHSVGDTYPWSVVGYTIEVNSPTQYRAENLVTGEQLPMRQNSMQAFCDAEHASTRSKALDTILAAGRLP